MVEKTCFSGAHQIGIIVRDMEKAVQFYESMGIGPFEPLKGPPAYDRRVYGKPADDVKNKMMMAQMGSMQLELVQPVSGKSTQREFLDKHGEGINHLGFYVDDIEKEIAKWTKRGFQVISSGKFEGGGGFAYLNTEKIGGVFFELLQESPLTKK